MLHDMLRPTKVDKNIQMPLKQFDNAVVNVLDHNRFSVSFLPKTQPESIGHLVGLKDLWLDGNQLTEIPAVSQLCSLLRMCAFMRILIKIPLNLVSLYF